MELHAEVSVLAEGLVAARRAGEDLGGRRRGERVEVELHPRPLDDGVRLVRVDGAPPVLVAPVGRVGGAAEDAGEELAAETDPEDRRDRVDHPPQVGDLVGEPGQGVVPGALGGTEHRDRGEALRVGQFGPGRARHDPHPALVGPGPQRPGLHEHRLRGHLVADHEHRRGVHPSMMPAGRCRRRDDDISSPHETTSRTFRRFSQDVTNDTLHVGAGDAPHLEAL